MSAVGRDLARHIARLFLGTRLPTVDGKLDVCGLFAPVKIRRDENGVVYIEARNDEDAWFGLGFCHGQDRAGQLEIFVRICRGTLAQVAGAEALPVDRLSRRLGLRRAARAQMAVADEDTKKQFWAYCRGLNAALAQQKPAHEHALLRTRPTMWEPTDVQAVCVLLCFALAANWDIELARLQILNEDGPEALRALDPAYPYWLNVSSPPGALAGNALDSVWKDIAVFTELVGVGTGGGSNAWAISGARTQSGRPLLANDPHLLPSVPTQWYLARLGTPTWSAAGATFVGIPALASGHNGHAAWGVTAAHVDNTDLFLEEIGPDQKSVREGNDFVPCTVVREIIEVRGQDPIVEDVLITRRGPIVGPGFDHQPSVSLAGTWLWPRPNRGLFGIHHIRSPEEFRRVFDAHCVSAGGLVYADEDGHIAWQIAASVPRRKKGFGTLPLPGWDPEVGWHEDDVPQSELPFCVDPKEGFVCTANGQPEAHGAGPFLGVDFLDGFRVSAITERLAARQDFTLDACRDLQADTESLPWRQLRADVLSVTPRTPAQKQALILLGAWDGRVATDSVAASVFELFVASMCRRIVIAKAPRSAHYALGCGFFRKLMPHSMLMLRRLGHFMQLLRDETPGFFPHGWHAEMADALHEAVTTLSNEHGNLADWRWGRVRTLTLVHALGEKRPLDALFNLGPFPGCGDATTVWQGAVDLTHPTGPPVAVPTLRTIIDVGDWDQSRFVLLGGQSGNPFSPHYDDQISRWQAAQGIPIAWSKENVARATRHLLVLAPA